MKIDFPCGDEIYKLRLNVPAENVRVIKSKNSSAKMNIEDQTREALADPIGSKKLSEHHLKGKRVVILVDDISRPTPADKIVPIVIERLKKAGADDITFIIARGAHMPGAHYLHEYMSTPSEAILKEQISKLGNEIVENFRVITHDGFNPDNVRYVGVSGNGTPIWINEEVLKADFKMAIGRVCPHLDVGYAGGAKMILPGVSGIETVFVNHLKFNTRFGYGTLYENPARRDIDEVGNIVGLDFILNFVLWMGQSRKAFAGDMNDAHRIGIEWGDRYVWGAEIGEKADITIVSTDSGGQGLEYARRCSTKRGGTIIYVSPEEEDVVIEKGNYVQELASIKSEYAKKMLLMDIGDLIRKETRFDFPNEIYHAHMNYTCRRAKLHYYQHHIIHVGGKLSENIIVYGEEMKREPMDHMESLDDAISQAIKEQGNNAKIIVIPEGDKTLPIDKIHEKGDFYKSSVYKALSNWEIWGGKPTYP
jgi:nickel-dependent lactate racemase